MAAGSLRTLDLWMQATRILIGLVAVGLAGCGSHATTPDAGGGDADVDAAGPTADDVLEPMRLHEIDIVMEPALVDGFDENQAERVPCDVRYDGTLLANAGCRKKGFIGSVDYASGKPAFSIKFDEYVDGQKLGPFDKLVLNNALQDPSILHEHVTYEVFRRIGIPAHRTAFAVVTFQGMPRGVYVVAEPVDREFLRDRFGRDNDEGNLYEASVVDFATDPDGLELKDPGTDRSDLRAAAAAVTGSSDAEFATAVGGVIDLDGALRFYAVEVALDAEDGLVFGRNNYYMYHRPDTDRFVFLPHGQDIIMGNPALPIDYPPPEVMASRIRGIPALAAMVDTLVLAMMMPGGAADPEVLARHIEAAVAVVTTTTRDDDFTVGDVATMTRDAPVFARQLAYRAARMAGTAGVPACGDGVLQGGERCDDGNEVAGDGCNAACYPECVPVTDGGQWLLCPWRPDWSDAVATCSAAGGQLVVPANATEAAQVAAIVRRRLGSADVWIALTDAASEGAWRTSSGAPAPYVSFGGNEPNGGPGENCAVIDTGLLGGFRDDDCNDDHAALCRM